MKSWTIIGWSYEADLHCTKCAEKAGMTVDGVVDKEGNTPCPIFASDELDPGMDHCRDCGRKLDE